MADITWQDVVDVAPKLANYSAGGQLKILALVNQDLSPADFGGVDDPRFTLARVYLAAHLGTLSRFAFGVITGESEGGVSRSYAIPPWANLRQTVFGQAYCDLLVAARAPVVL